MAKKNRSEFGKRDTNNRIKKMKLDRWEDGSKKRDKKKRGKRIDDIMDLDDE